ncbi:MAG: hypothetical protein Ctma_0627 [Catillopecten margaritatus gill symbiont]|uniref:Glycosyltransferase 2-like domain-containing protein n=1 Tax=Catillopecten margaritatus gill symbiont TaxID=3083288 RepID=A0AAU6PFW4_9GAMM
MPVFNGEQYLKECIDSVLCQTFVNFEFIIINDGSTDRTEEIILSYVDKRIFYVKNKENLRIADTLNKGIKFAKGKYIARIDADDICLPSRFEVQVNFMQKNPDIDICGSWMQCFNEIGDTNLQKNPILNNEIQVALLFNSCIGHPTVMGKKDFFCNLKYRKQYNGAEDYDLWVRGSEQYHYANIPSALIKYRIHSNQTNGIKPMKVAYRVRCNYLKTVCPMITDKEVRKFTDIAYKIFIRKKTSKKIIDKILLGNSKTNILDNNILKEQLEIYCQQATNSEKSSLLKRYTKTVLSNLFGDEIITQLVQVKRIFK